MYTCGRRRASGLSPVRTFSQQTLIDLATALSTHSPAKPGDTIWLRGGTYTGTYISYLTGTQAAPITVRQYPGERATLNGGGSSADLLTVYGEWAVYWGFELTAFDPGRLSAQTTGRRQIGRAHV